MIRRIAFAAFGLLVAGSTVVACGGNVLRSGAGDGAGASDGTTPGDGTCNTAAKPDAPITPLGTLTKADKVDLLLVVDNSAAMARKQALFRESVPDLVGRLIAPDCVDPSGHVLGSSIDGVCSVGTLEFAPVKDLHVGVISTSLGSRGGDACELPMNGGSSSNENAHLLTSGVLTFPSRFGENVAQFKSDLGELIGGVGGGGCGYEAQLESWYRFLVQPDPYRTITVGSNGEATLVGIDGELLKQRKAFLRPDSLVAVVLLTDEDDSTADPLSLNGQGWAFMSTSFPGSTVPRESVRGLGTTAPRGTSACAKDPNSDACTSCAYQARCTMGGNARCAAIQSDPNCTELAIPGQSETAGYFGPKEDDLNVRFYRMKERFGVDPQFPISRYVWGLSSAKVPDREHEHAPRPEASTLSTAEYTNTPACDNPLFAASLPAGADEELCHLPAGPRSPDLVVFGVITGVPSTLLASPLDDAAWTKIHGAAPSRYDYSGIDPHMLPSTTPRAGLPTSGDPVHGGERDTSGKELQYACNISDPFAGSVTSPADAEDPTAVDDSHLNATPGLRHLELVHELGTRGLASSICPTSFDPQSPNYAYRGAMRALGDRMARSLR